MITITKSEKKVRRCLRCGKDFLSEGAHNRICSDCKNSSCYYVNKICCITDTKILNKISHLYYI